MTIVSLPDIAELRTLVTRDALAVRSLRVHTSRPDAQHGTRPSDLRVSHTD